MTYAPADLMAVRAYLLKVTGLSGDAVGIVGDPDHAATGGYHEGNDDLARVGRLTSDYSKRESSRDRPGSNAASALDVGQWSGRRGKAQITWLQFNAAWLDACQRGDPRTKDQRELIYTLDGKTVRRWDVLKQRSTGDSSHLYHTHGSWFRDSEGRRAGVNNTLGLLQAILDGSDDVAGYGYPDPQMPEAEAFRMDALMSGSDKVRGGPRAGEPMWLVLAVKRLEQAAAADEARDVALKAAFDAMAAQVAAGGGNLDTAAIIARINAVAAEAGKTVAALQAELADRDQRLADALSGPEEKS